MEFSELFIRRKSSRRGISADKGKGASECRPVTERAALSANGSEEHPLVDDHFELADGLFNETDGLSGTVGAAHAHHVVAPVAFAVKNAESGFKMLERIFVFTEPKILEFIFVHF
jgi:hypothetical protein